MSDQTNTGSDKLPDLPEDLLARDAAVKTLSTLLFSNAQQTDRSNLVETIAICGGWGTGKTWFVKAWSEHLRQNNQVQVVYLSAWENDYGDDPIASLLQQLKKQLPFDESVLAKISAWFKQHSKSISLVGAMLGAQQVSGMLEEALQEREDAVTALKQLLVEIAKPAPVVVFVDELDRCRPRHAITMLERVKHVFRVPGITFVLSIDKTNLKKSIRSVNGEIDADDYLRRFFDFEYHLRQTSSIQFVNSLFSHKQLDVSDVVPTLMLASNLSLRSIQRVATGIKLVMNSGLLSDVFFVDANDEPLKSAHRLFDQHSELRVRPSLNANFVDQSVGLDNADFSSYRDKVPNPSLFIQDFAWGIVAWSMIRKCGVQQPFKSNENRLDRASRDQSTTWDKDSTWELGSTGRSLQSQHKQEFGSRYLVRMLQWLSSMAIHCDELIQSNEDKWITQTTNESLIAGVVWDSVKNHFLENTHGIIADPNTKEIDVDNPLQHKTELKLIAVELSSVPHLRINITNSEDLEFIRREIALRALASASIATAKVCQIMRDNPDLLGVITGNHDCE